jgi:hypothetical protein
MKIYNLFLGAFLFIFLSSLSFVDEQKFVQFKINSITGKDQALVIDQKMRAIPGIEMSRTDHLSSTYHCVISSGFDYDQVKFKTWFLELGYTISCFNKGIQNQDQWIPAHQLKNCQ